ncbi:MAG: phosphonoacetaldehyde reductase [Clostridia bacterium]
MFNPFCPVDVRVLQKTEGLQTVRDFFADRKQQLLVLAPRSLCDALGLASFFAALQSDGHALRLESDIPANPSVGELSALLAQLRGQPFVPTAILAIGGGSCMDLGKGVSALLHLPHTGDEQEVRAAIQQKAYLHEHPFVDLVVMPTTAGTGSEVTQWATIWDTTNAAKLSIDCEGCFARAAVLIPEWTVGMPPELTLSTGLDALTHAVEAFWSVNRTPLAQALAFTSIQKIHDFLPMVLQNPRSLSMRREMTLGALLAGLAFSQTHTTACHSISYPLTMSFGIPHGYAAALTLCSVWRRNQEVVAELKKLDALFANEGGIERWLEAVCVGVQPLCLRAFGVREEGLSGVADRAFTAGRMDHNPVPFTREDVLDILRECL